MRNGRLRQRRIRRRPQAYTQWNGASLTDGTNTHAWCGWVPRSCAFGIEHCVHVSLHTTDTDSFGVLFDDMCEFRRAEDMSRLQRIDTLQRTEAHRKHLMRTVSSHVAPLVDRLGRLMADLAPHLQSLDESPSPTEDPSPSPSPSGVSSSATTAAQSTSSGSTSLSSPFLRRRNASDAPQRRDAGSTGLSSSPPTRPPDLRGSVSTPLTNARTAQRDGGRQGQGQVQGQARRRPRSPSPTSAYRQLIATPARLAPFNNAPPGGGNIDIHIHAIVTPMRNVNANGNEPRVCERFLHLCDCVCLHVCD